MQEWIEEKREHLLLESLPNIVLLFTYIVVLIALGLQAEELFFLLPVVEGTDCGDDEHSHENGKALDPRYLIWKFNKISLN